MKLQAFNNTKAKPFLKWAGGKTQLLPTLNSFLPPMFDAMEEITYIEPFVGGGAMLFFLLQRYPNISKAVINDINSHLINAYKTIKNNPNELVSLLKDIQTEYRNLDDTLQKEFYQKARSTFNHSELTDLEDAAWLIFLNRTCFNGLYRENSKGEFNVPFGRYAKPTICDEDLIFTDSEALKRVEILCGDFSQVEYYVDNHTFMYFDPPYRPLDQTSNFNSYVKEQFDDNEQQRLKDFCKHLLEYGCSIMLSNSDGKSHNSDDFLDRLYSDFIVDRVAAKRCINANGAKRGILTELLIHNYPIV